MALSNDRISDPTKASRFWINSPRNKTLNHLFYQVHHSTDVMTIMIEELCPLCFSYWG
jgi:hypothetical protein